MKKIYLILITVLLFNCSADESREDTECVSDISTGVYTDEFSFFEDKPLTKVRVTTLDAWGEIISEEIYSGEDCFHNSLYTFRKDRTFHLRISTGLFSSPNGCYYYNNNDEYYYNTQELDNGRYLVRWKPFINNITSEDCTVKDVLKIDMISEIIGTDFSTIFTYTVKINNSSLIFDRTYVLNNGLSTRTLTERTVYIIN